MLEGWNYRLDPSIYVKSYINKVYQDSNTNQTSSYRNSALGGSEVESLKNTFSTITSQRANNDTSPGGKGRSSNDAFQSMVGASSPQPRSSMAIGQKLNSFSEISST